MSTVTENHVREILPSIVDPNADKNVVSMSWLRRVRIDGTRVSVDLRTG